MRKPVPIGLIAACIATPCLAQTGRPSSGTILHFASGDSVEYIDSGPMYLATGQPGFLIAFHPFVAIEDTVKLRAVGGQVWSWLRPRLDSVPTFVVLQADTLRAHSAPGIQKGEGRNLVLERRADGNWYFLNETKPAP